MPVTKYTKNYPADFPALVTAQPNGYELERAITWTIPSAPIDAANGIQIGITAGECNIWFSDVLSAPDEATFDAIIAAHTGVQINAKLAGTLQCVVDPISITEDATWQELFELETTPSFFVDNINELFARIIGRYKAVLGGGGEKPQIQVVEEVDGMANEDKYNPPYEFDAAADWTKFKCDSNVPPRDGIRNTYTVYARLNGAASFELRYTTISMVCAQAIM